MNYELQILGLPEMAPLGPAHILDVPSSSDAMNLARHVLEFHIGCPPVLPGQTIEQVLNAVEFHVVDCKNQKLVGIIRPTEIWGDAPIPAGGGMLQ